MCYFLYKNITYSLTLLWFCVTASFSAQPLFDDAYLSLFNLVFTSLPVMAFALLDRDIHPAAAARHPELYRAGPANHDFSQARLGRFVGGAVAHSALLFFLPLHMLADPGPGLGLAGAGTLVLWLVVVCVTGVMALVTASWTWVQPAVYAGSLAVCAGFLLAYHAVPLPALLRLKHSVTVHGAVYQLSAGGGLWLALAPVLALCWVPMVVLQL